jgi:cobyrinic acid a,c-diamide synthase
MESKSFPRLTVGAPKGRSGKTSVTIGLIGALTQQGQKVIPFKKGPDFIDPAWLSLAAGNECHILDLFLFSHMQNLTLFAEQAQENGISIIEGNMGLFDGIDAKGSGSTAELAKLLKSPVILVLDVTRMTRTAAAIVKGLAAFDPELNLAGIILNRVGSHRQELLVRTAIEDYCGLPVIGAIPKFKNSVIDERHLGLVPPIEYEKKNEVVDFLSTVIKDNVDLELIKKLAQTTPKLFLPDLRKVQDKPMRVRIGIFKDVVFQFYYPENLRALKREGAELIEIDSLKDQHLPQIDGLYLGGGFPEVQAEALAENRSLKEAVAAAAERGLPIYAECGGLIYLGQSLLTSNGEYPMAGVFPVSFALESVPVGHGYMHLEVVEDNPYYPKGVLLKGHEFHYTRPLIEDLKITHNNIGLIFNVKRGTGFYAGRDGLVKGNTLAHYAHFHAAAIPQWAENFVNLSAWYHQINSPFNL